MNVSIIITNYNYEKYIEQCIKSCLDQKTKYEFEVIVIDDGSNDNSLAIISKYSSKIKIICTSNSGIEKACNTAVNYSKGEYIIRVDADDKLAQDYIEIVFPYIDESDFSFVYTNYYIIDEDCNQIGVMSLPEFSKNEIMDRGDFLATGTMMRKSDFYEVGCYNDSEKNCGLENYELVLKFLKNSRTGYLVNKNLFYYRRHSKNLSEIKKKKIIEYGNMLSIKFGMNNYCTNKYHPYGLKI